MAEETTFGKLKPGDLFRTVSDPSTPAENHFIRIDPHCDFLRHVAFAERIHFCLEAGTGVVAYFNNATTVWRITRSAERAHVPVDHGKIDAAESSE